MIPDPIELMEMRQERLAFEWEEAQAGVPEGKHRCPYCRQIFDYEPIATSSRPDSPVCCYDCLSPDAKEAYDAFEASVQESTDE